MITTKKNKNKNDNKNEDKNDHTIEKFTIKQTINNIFNLNNINNLQDNNELFSTCINTYSDGLVIGSNKGNLLFLERFYLTLYRALLHHLFLSRHNIQFYEHIPVHFLL